MQIKRQGMRLLLLLAILITGAFGRNPDAAGRRGMVVSGDPTASRFGLNILKRGGNAVDAAIATGFALAVVEPRAGNLGGGGFMVIRLSDGTATTIDFREKAPAAVTWDMYLDERGAVVRDRSTRGILASGVPGTVRGFGLAYERYGSGRIDWSGLLTESISLADNGLIVAYELHKDLVDRQDFLSRYEETRQVFYPRSQPPNLNARFRQPDLAATLRRIAYQGPEDFYTGRTARLVVNHMDDRGGLITMEDLAQYQAVERPAITFNYRDVQVITMGPPSSGGIVLAEILNMLEQEELFGMPFHGAEHIHAMVEAERRAYADRAHYLGDPDFVDMPVVQLVSDGYAARRWSDFSPRWAGKSETISYGDERVLHESSETTHFSVVDRWGNAVAVTFTLNGLYGSGEMVKGAGFLLNNQMDDFSAKPGHPDSYGLMGSEANAIAPGKRMLSSMTPTIVTRNDSLLMIIGSPGGSTIITTVAQIIVAMVDYNMTLKVAVETPRFHHQWLPDEIMAEFLAISPETAQRLARMGHKLRPYYNPAHGGTIGAANCIHVDPVTGYYFGVADSRREAAAAGY